MFGGLTKKKESKTPIAVFGDVIGGLQHAYEEKLLPLEEHYKFHDFQMYKLEPGNFTKTPSIMIMGQYSTGKTTFINHVLGNSYPGQMIGPEPTTDKFNVIMNGKQGVTPGNALVSNPNLPYKPTSRFGNNFLTKFQCCTFQNDVLQNITFIDTPGILAGEKNRLDRGYEFVEVMKWFADVVDRIIIVFDAHKLDISDELKRCIEALHGNEDKVRIVLNKADVGNQQQLMRVYGALMWNLGKVLNTPEVSKIFIGSFWNEPLQNRSFEELFQSEQRDLFDDFKTLPQKAALRKLNDLIKRARAAKLHAFIISHIKKKTSVCNCNPKNRKKYIIKHLDDLFAELVIIHKLSPGDFPDIEQMQTELQHCEFSKFRKLNQGMLDDVNSLISEDIARLINMLPSEELVEENRMVHGGVFDDVFDISTPFGYGRETGFDLGAHDEGWVIETQGYKEAFQAKFDDLAPVNGKLSASIAKEEMKKSKLPNTELGKIWKLSDTDADGQMDADEFAVAMYLIKVKLDGNDLPSKLPQHILPPSKKKGRHAQQDSSVSSS